jgi:hypothetical protein
MQRASFGMLGVLLILFFIGCYRQPSEVCAPVRMDDNIKPEENTMTAYEDFLLGIEKIHVGNKKDDVKTILGEPESRSETIWRYDLKNHEGFPGIPPASGTTVFVGFDIVFENDQVKEIQRHWMDVTGPPQ